MRSKSTVPEWLCAFAALWLGACTCVTKNTEERKPKVQGILYNEDDSHRFGLNPAGEMTPETLDGLVDDLADSQVSAMLVCCCAQRASFPSKAWEPYHLGYDPAKGSDQPYFGDTTPEARKWLGQWAANQLKMFQMGIDPTGRMLDRCRQKGISPWVSVRMNDIHDADRLTSPLHCTLWKERHDLWRYPDRFRSWTDRSFDYGKQEVRDRTEALIRELCELYDMDGLELDWMRFPYHFREGEEIQQSKVLTEWMQRMRGIVDDAASRRGHPIILAARVAARPEVARGIGTDAVEWARLGIIDHLIVAPFWTSTDNDVPVEEWTSLLEGTGVGVTAGLEIRVQPYPGAPTVPNTPERRRGSAMSMLGRGSQGVYLFNHFDMPKAHAGLLREIGSIDTLRGKDRSYVVTFTDTCIPGKPIPHQLPARIEPGKSSVFRIHVGPEAEAGARCTVSMAVSEKEEGAWDGVAVGVNGRPAEPSEKPGEFMVGEDDLSGGYNRIEVINGGGKPITVTFVELSLRFGG